MQSNLFNLGVSNKERIKLLQIVKLTIAMTVNDIIIKSTNAPPFDVINKIKQTKLLNGLCDRIEELLVHIKLVK